MTYTTTWARLAVVLVAVASATGCNLIGFAAHVIAGDHPGKTKVSAAYRGLANHTAAVLVSTDDYTFFEHPGATAAVCREVSAQLVAQIPGVQVIDPVQIQQFHQENPYWNTLPHGDLIKRLGVDRLIYIDVVQFATREPGNAYLWQGVMTANLGVAEAESPNANDFAFATAIQARYPETGSVGVLNADHDTIQLGLLRVFSGQVMNLFRDHEVVNQ